MLDVRLEQRAPAVGDVAANADAVVDACDAARGDADLVVLPELFLTGYHVPPADLSALAPAVADALDRVRAAAADLVVVVGAPVARDAADPYNAAVVFDDGERAGTVDKVHAYGDEPDRFAAGDACAPVDTSLGTLGVEICYDLEFPEVARTLALRGADLLVTISANMRPFEAYQRTYARARAMENGLPHVLCNRVGAEGPDDFFGESVALDAAGEPVARAPADGETTLAAALPDVAPDESLSYLADRRPAAYE